MIYRIKNCLTSERLRKKLVYQRLENINRLFTGLGLNSWENSMLGKTLIFSGGKIDLEFAAEYLGAQKFDSIVCADSGLEAARLLNQDVDFFMGDFDSVSDDTLKEFMKSKAEYIRYPEEKDETDTELVINWVVENGATEIIILGATGGRLDHLLANINLLMIPLKKGVPAYIIDSNNKLCLIEKRHVFFRDKAFGKYVSFQPLTERVSNIYMTGFKYILEGEELCIGTSRAVSNEFDEKFSKAEISFDSGVLIAVESRD